MVNRNLRPRIVATSTYDVEPMSSLMHNGVILSDLKPECPVKGSQVTLEVHPYPLYVI